MSLCEIDWLQKQSRADYLDSDLSYKSIYQFMMVSETLSNRLVKA